MRNKMLFLSFAVAMSCTAAQADDTEQIRPRGWSLPDAGFSIRLHLDAATVAPKGMLQPELFLRATASDKGHAKLLQGQFVFTLVPFGQPIRREGFSTRHHFSGAGGLDYSGKTPVEYQAFLMTARMKIGEGRWWTGTMSTSPMLVVVSADAEAAVRMRAQELIRALQQRRWTEAARFVVVVTGKHDATTRTRMGIPDHATQEVVEKRVAEWFRQLYDVVQPGTNVSVRIDIRDRTLAQVTYRAGDLDAFYMRLVDGQWYYTLD